MSNYFQTLKRLEQEQSASRAAPVQLPVVEQVKQPEPTEAAEPAATPRIQTIQAPQRVSADERTVGSFASLFDNLRALGNGAPVGSIAVAGVSSVESVERISSGLAGEICRHSLRVLVGELYRSVSQPVLRVRMASRDDRGEPRVRAVGQSTHQNSVAAKLAANSLQLDLRGGPIPPELTDWLDTARAAHDVVIIEAPPLGISVDAAMLARACDGLLLVVEPRATSRDALVSSIERAQTVGCNILGIVMQGRPERMPTWLRRVTSTKNLF